jgi:tetratricopeptide (TPR) repeat protein
MIMTTNTFWLAAALAALFVIRADVAWGGADLHSELARADLLSVQARDKQKTGAYSESEHLLREVLALRTRHLPPADVQVGQAMNDLGVALFHQTRFNESESMYRQALASFGEERKSLADRIGVLGNLATLFREQRRFDEAEKIYTEVFEIAKDPSAVNELLLAALLNDYGVLQKLKGNTTGALQALERCAEIRERKLPAGHPHLVSVWTALADLHYTTRAFAVSEQLFRKAVETCDASLGKHNRVCAPAVNGLALTLVVRGMPEEAERLFQRALTVFEQTYGTEHPRVAAVLNNMGTLAERRGDFKKGERYLQRALDVWIKVYGPSHSDVASTYTNLASAYLRKKQYQKAEPLFHRALAIDEKIFGFEHDRVAVDLNNLAALYNEMKRYNESDMYFARAIAVYEKLPTAFELSFAGLLSNFAAQRSNRKMYEESAALYKRAVAICERHPGSETPLTASLWESYAQVLRKLEEPAEAHKAELAAMRIRVQNTIANERLSSGFARK